jgi:uncharacterized protein (TIGR00106 family)
MLSIEREGETFRDSGGSVGIERQAFYLKRRCFMAILEVSIVPIGIQGSSLSSYVADCLRILKEEKVRYELTAMGTNVEGELKKLIKIALRMHDVPFKKGAPRVLTTLKIDDRRDKKGTLSGKKSSVQSKLK